MSIRNTNDPFHCRFREAIYKNFLYITLRTLRKQALNSFINVVGLAVGIACCLLIVLFVRDELTYDHFHENSERIYRITRSSVSMLERGTQASGTTSPPLASTLQEALPDVEQAVRLWSWPVVVQQSTQVFNELVHFTDSSFFEVFTFPMRKGDPETVLLDPNSVVVTPETARKYFGTEDPIGQQLLMQFGDTFQTLTVTGLTEPIPTNSSIQFDFLVPFQKVEMIRGQQYVESWGNFSINTFVMLHPEATAGAVDAKVPGVLKNYVPQEELGELNENGVAFALQPLTDIHLNLDVGSSLGVTGISNPIYSYILSGVALLILLMACINFMNLSIGLSLPRAKEVGVRKVMGAYRRHLMAQFWGEALLMSTLGLLLGLGIAEFFLPVFRTLSGKALSISALNLPLLLSVCAALVLVTGFVAGSYPSLILSRMHPVSSLRGQLKVGGRNRFTRGLVVFQFVLAVFLIAATLVIRSQLMYVQTKDLGYDPEDLLALTINRNGGQVMEALRNEIAGQSGIVAISGDGKGWSDTSLEIAGRTFDVFHFRVDFDYINTLGITLKDGRNLSRDFPSDLTGAVLVNDTFVREAGLANPVGTQLTFTYSQVKDPVIVGVVEDYHFQPLQEEIHPLMLHLEPNWPIGRVWVRLAGDDASSALAWIEDTWHRVAPLVPFNYQFQEMQLEQQYRNEARWQQIMGYAALLVVFIACLGLFGLAALAVNQRTKEIGMRKVLGASVSQIALLLATDFAKLVLVAFVIAAPLAYVVASKWLEGFAYKITLGPAIFLLSGGLALLIAVLTVSYQTIKAACMNPVNALRDE